jgi:hypothetical protein
MPNPNVPNLEFSTVDLIQVVPTLKRPSKFLLDKFFPFTQMSETEYVAIDIDVGKRRMSPFVSPLVEGKLVEQRGRQLNLYKPPYIKDKRAPDLRKPVMRQIGERIGGGQLKGAEREMANINAEMTDQVDMIDRRLEWMAASALQTGQVVVSGEGFPTEVIDFGRDPSLTVALTGASQWGVVANFDAEGRDPVPTRSIERWQQRILRLSGAQATDLVFTTSSWACFQNAKSVYGAIAFPKQNDFGNAINPGAQIAPGAVYKGRWGQYDLWLYNEWYVDEDNVEQPMLVDGTVLMSGADLMGIRAFGVIMDPAFNYESLPYAPKTWLKEDPGQRMMMMQSSPLVIPSRVNASLAATVCAPQSDLSN